MSTTKEHLDRIAALTTERNAVVILLRAKTDTATWGKYPETLQAAVEAEYAALTVERDQLDAAHLHAESELALTQSQLEHRTVERDQARADAYNRHQLAKSYAQKLELSRATGCWCDEHGHPCQGCEWKERIATLEAENLALRSEEWLCVLCRASFGERRAAISPVDTPQTAEECECCGALATKKDVDGVPLCDGCYEDLKRETNALASPSEEPK